MAQTFTKTITNWQGSMTVYENGDSNSGRSNVFETFGNNPFIQPNNLTWNLAPTQIDPNGSVITDMIMAGKERVESGTMYVYAIGHTGRLYKIQVNDPASHNPDYDNPVLLTTLTSNSPTFTRGGFIDFYGATERIYIGHDKGVTRVDFTGSNETFVGVLGSWTQTVPRPLKQFVGKLYVGNGTNIAEIDTTASVTTYTKLSPAFAANTQVRDMDVNVEGTYLEMIVSRQALGDITSTTQDTSTSASAESYIFRWNGTDAGYSSFTTFPSFSLGANILFGGYQYTFGYDQNGSAIFNPISKMLTEPEVKSPLPNAITSSGNMVSWIAPVWVDGTMIGVNNTFGQFDWEIGLGYYTNFIIEATSPETDIIQIPCQISVSNFGLGATSNGYTNGLFSTGKIYFSTLETSSAPTTKYRLYKWSPTPSPAITYTGTPIQGVYQTQTDLYSKKIKLTEIRVYGDPWVTNNSFQIDMVGSDGSPISGASKTFTAGTNLTVGTDFAWYTPQSAPTYAVAVRITNLGTVNHVINKIEYDYELAGK